jgi:hypothetical protein
LEDDVDVERPGKCPYCPAEYSTASEMRRHLESKWEHIRERFAATTASLINADRHVTKAADLLDNLTASRVFDAQLVRDLAAVRSELRWALVDGEE